MIAKHQWFLSFTAQYLCFLIKMVKTLVSVLQLNSKLSFLGSPFVLMFNTHTARIKSYKRQRCCFVHSSNLKRPKCNAATKHLTFGVIGVMLNFPQVDKISLIVTAIDVAAHNWTECNFSLSEGCWKTICKTVIELRADWAGLEKVDTQKKVICSCWTHRTPQMFL